MNTINCKLQYFKSNSHFAISATPSVATNLIKIVTTEIATRHLVPNLVPRLCLFAGYVVACHYITREQAYSGNEIGNTSTTTGSCPKYSLHDIIAVKNFPAFFVYLEVCNMLSLGMSRKGISGYVPAYASVNSSIAHPPRAFALFFCPGAGHWYLQSCRGELFTGRAFDSTGRFCDEHVLLY